MNLLDSTELVSAVRGMLSAPEAFDISVETMRGRPRQVLIEATQAPATEGLLPRSRALIEITGTGRYILRLDDCLSIDEIYDHDDDGVDEIFAEFCVFAQQYLSGAGKIVSHTARRATHLSIVLCVGEDQYLSDGGAHEADVVTCAYG